MDATFLDKKACTLRIVDQRYLLLSKVDPKLRWVLTLTDGHQQFSFARPLSSLRLEHANIWHDVILAFGEAVEQPNRIMARLEEDKTSVRLTFKGAPEAFALTLSKSDTEEVVSILDLFDWYQGVKQALVKKDTDMTHKVTLLEREIRELKDYMKEREIGFSPKAKISTQALKRLPGSSLINPRVKKAKPKGAQFGDPDDEEEAENDDA